MPILSFFLYNNDSNIVLALVWFDSLRPSQQLMVMLGRSVHLTTFNLAVKQYFVHIFVGLIEYRTSEAKNVSVKAQLFSYPSF